jgi:glutamate transport system permease protein
MSSVLYDNPGPKAIVRNRILSLVSGLVVAGALVWVIYKFYQQGQFESLLWQQFQYQTIQQELLDGYLSTLKVAGIAMVGALLFGAIFATGRLSDHWFLRTPSTFVVELFRAIPLLILIFFGYYIPLQYEAIPNFDKRWALVIGLVLYNGSVLAETFRAGMISVPRGQSEAGYAIGLRKTRVNTLILLPQAVRAMLPAIVSQLVVLLKDTALGFLVTYDELLKQVKQLAASVEFGYPLIPLVLVCGAMYIATCLLLSWFATWLERRLSRSPRTSAPIITGDPGDQMGQPAPL